MSSRVKRWWARWLGRGDAGGSVPPFDGVLKPNQRLETAEVLAHFEHPADMAIDSGNLWVADGPRVWQVDPFDGSRREIAVFDDAVTALAGAGQKMAVALGGRRVRLISLTGGAAGPKPAVADASAREWNRAGQASFVSVNSLSFLPDGSLLATEGSAHFECDRWSHDLMSLGHSGRLVRLDLDGTATVLKDDLEFAFGACAMADGRIWVSESWRHRVLSISPQLPSAVVPPASTAASSRPPNGGQTPVLDRLPGYPSRLSPAPGGGAWLTVFTCRTQLVEMVLREPEFRRRMVAEVDPRYWVAPALSSGHSFLEPLQGGGVKTMGVLKPWAPPRSYGLVIRLAADGRMAEAMHSRVGGRHHGVVAAVQLGSNLYALAKGSGCVLRIPLPDTATTTAPTASSAPAPGVLSSPLALHTIRA
ncbi:MAG TPA: strictosidine synthase [Burkholderiaceae bacterium]|nr:strictosidine synthase [Burkholderiaceae bacterium]